MVFRMLKHCAWNADLRGCHRDFCDRLMAWNCSQPALEVLDANRMLGLRILHLYQDRRLIATNAFGPFIVAKNPQRLGNRLVEAVGAHIDRMRSNSLLFATLVRC